MTDKSILTLQHPGEPAKSAKIDTKGYVSETAERVIELANENERLKAIINDFLFFSGSYVREFYLKRGSFDFSSPKAEIQAAAILDMNSQLKESNPESNSIMFWVIDDYAKSLTASKEV